MINSQASLGEDLYKTPDESNGDNFHKGLLNQFGNLLNYNYPRSFYTQETIDAIAKKHGDEKVEKFLSHSYNFGFDNEDIISFLENDLENSIFEIRDKLRKILGIELPGKELLQLAIEIQNKVLRIY